VQGALAPFAKERFAIDGPDASIAGNGAFRPAVPGIGVPNNTGADLWTIRYVYTFSKRTEFNFGYVYLDNDSRAAYALGGLTAPNMGQNQGAFALSMRHTF